MEYLDIPRSIDENGEQRDIVALQIKNEKDASRLPKGAIVDLEPSDYFLFLEPWVQLVSDHEAFAKQLQKEVSSKHVLYGKTIKVIGRRQDNDDVLIELEDERFRFAVVHLTWAKQANENRMFPRTQLFTSWIDVYNNRIVADHEEYMS